MNQNKHNFQKDINLLIPNIDTTSERLSSDNRPGTFLKNTLTEKSMKRSYQGQIITNITIEKENHKFSNNLISKTMRNTPNNYNRIKDYQSSQKETQEMTHKKSSINSQKSLNKKLENERKSNYKNIIKKINMNSSENSKKMAILKNKIPLRTNKNISNINNVENKDSYIYLMKLKNNYSTDKLKEENSYYTNIQRNNNSNYKMKKNNTQNLMNKNLTENNFYPPKNNSKYSKKLNKTPKNVSINNKDNSNKKNRLNRNISFPYFNKMNILNSNINPFNNINDFSEILNVRRRYNETCCNFYQNNSQKKTNSKLIRNLTENNTFKKLKIKKEKSNNFNTNHTSDYSSINFYWYKRSKDKIQKLSQIKNELIQKEKNEIQLIPKINQKSKELAENADKYKIEFNNIYDKLFYINNLNLNLNIDKENNNKFKIKNNNNNIEYQPLINEKSQNMKRTIDDLYMWQNKKENKIKQNEENILQKTVYNKKNTNLASEIILKERRPNYFIPIRNNYPSNNP